MFSGRTKYTYIHQSLVHGFNRYNVIWGHLYQNIRIRFVLLFFKQDNKLINKSNFVNSFCKGLILIVKQQQQQHKTSSLVFLLWLSNIFRDIAGVCAYAVHRADSIKVALGIGNWAFGNYCLVVSQANHRIVLYAQIPNAQSPTTNCQSNLNWIRCIHVP